MLNKIRTFFYERIEQSAGHNGPLAINLAAAALLIEVLKADFQPDPREELAIKAALHKHLNVAVDEIEELFVLASAEIEDATSLFQFTNLVNGHYSTEQKYQLVCAMWKVAYADGVLDAYEEHLIRQIADLIHLPHQQFIQAKRSVRDTL